MLVLLDRELCPLTLCGAVAGWMALLALAALITVMVGSAMFAYRRFMGIDQPYTIVTKQGDV